MKRLLASLFILLIIANFPVNRPCVECGETAVTEPAIKLLWPAAPFVHYECLN